ncbi:hypothetical protein ACR79T_10220 [Sphingobacterium spiritivorum]|uniref:hypothetical protein n=1 Tax=Sphingobacterium spiritivorum TaxID=258 RepID=UPI003DA5B7B2
MILLDACSLCNWIFDRENLADFIVPILATIIGLFVAFLIFRTEIRINKKKEKEDESIIKQIVLASLIKEREVLKNVIDQLNNFLDINEDSLMNLDLITTKTVYIHTILKIDIKLLIRSLSSNLSKQSSSSVVVDFVSLLNNIIYTTNTLIDKQDRFSHVYSNRSEIISNKTLVMLAERESMHNYLPEHVCNNINRVNDEYSGRLQEIDDKLKMDKTNISTFGLHRWFATQIIDISKANQLNTSKNIILKFARDLVMELNYCHNEVSKFSDSMRVTHGKMQYLISELDKYLFFFQKSN